MYRDEAVQLMTDTINNFNRQVAAQQGADAKQVEEYIMKAQPELMYVNGMLYDMLKENGVING
jgi:predicted methyltransferase